MSDSPIDTLPPRRASNVVLQPAGWPQPKGYANGIKARGDLLFVGGMVGWDEREPLSRRISSGRRVSCWATS